MGPSFCTTSGAGGGKGLATAPWRCAWGAWPKGAGTTVPGCTRGNGAGALVRVAGVDGHGGSGVLEHAVSNAAASSADAFHGIRSRWACGGWAEEASGESLWRVECMFMVIYAIGPWWDGFVTWMLPARQCHAVSAYIPLQTHDEGAKTLYSVTILGQEGVGWWAGSQPPWRGWAAWVRDPSAAPSSSAAVRARSRGPSGCDHALRGGGR